MQTPEDYRQRAAFLRKLADHAMTQALKDSYLELAANWDALADEAAGKDPGLKDFLRRPVDDRPDYPGPLYQGLAVIK